MSIKRLDPKEASIVWNKLNTYDSPVAEAWRIQCLENRKFYEGEQSTPEEREKIAERGQYDITINKIRKAIKGMMGLVTSSIPKFKLIPVGENDELKADLGNKLLDWAWNGTEGLHVYRSAVKSALIDNMSFLQVIYSKDKRVKFVNLEYDDVIVDPNSKDPLFSDAEMIVVRRYLPVNLVRKMYNVGGEILSTSLPEHYRTEILGNTIDIRKQNFLGKVYSSDGQYVNVYECYRKEYIDNKDYTYQIVKETVLGYMHVFREELPIVIREYPIIPIYVEGYANPYKRGEVHFLKDIQKFINKVYGVTILNAQLSSSPKAFVRQRDIPRGNLEDFQADYNKPGSINVLSDDANPPILVQGQPLNNAFFSIYQDAKQEFNNLTLPPEMLGYSNPSAGYQSSSSLLEMKESALDSMKDFVSVIEMACSRLGLVTLQYIQGYVEKNTIINISDMEGRIKSFKVNQEQGLDVNNEQSVAQFIQSMEQNGVSDEEIQDILAKAKEDSDYMESLTYVINETDFSMFDVRVIPGSYSPTYMMAMLKLMMELVNTGSVDPSVPLDYLPTPNKEELKKRFDTINMLNGQVNALEEELESIKRLLEDRNKKMMDNNISTIEAKARLKYDKTLQEQRIKQFRAKAMELIKGKEQQLKFEKLYNDYTVSLERQMFREKVSANDDQQQAIGNDTLESMMYEELHNKENE